MDTRKFLGWKMINGWPHCKAQSPVIYEKVIRQGYFTKRWGKPRYIPNKIELCTSKSEVRICGWRMEMDEAWQPTPAMDSWLTKWKCPKCGTEEYINRAVLPLECGGRR